MLPNFNYLKAKTIKDALNYLQLDNATLIAGGTDLLVEIRNKMKKPDIVIDIKDIPELSEISEAEDEVFIGSSVTFSELINSKIIANNFRLLSQAVRNIGSPQIRNTGTIGGNVQTASPAGDGLVALLALDAKVELISLEGRREVSIEDFVIGPKKTIKNPDELIKGFKIPKNSYDYQLFFKLGKRNALAISIVNGVIKLNFDDDKIVRDAVIILGSVAPTPIKLKKTEKILFGKKYDDKLALKMKEEIIDEISPITDIRATKEYRRYIAAVMCDRAIKASLE